MLTQTVYHNLRLAFLFAESSFQRSLAERSPEKIATGKRSSEMVDRGRSPLGTIEKLH